MNNNKMTITKAMQFKVNCEFFLICYIKFMLHEEIQFKQIHKKERH